jgi:hypothetical protein
MTLLTLVAATLIYMAQSEGYVHLKHGDKTCQTSHMYVYLKHITKMWYECFNTLLNFGISF